MKNRGITLIEVLVYIALFSLIIGGAMVSVWNTTTSMNRNQTDAELEIQGNFLLDKLSYNASTTPTIPGEQISFTYLQASTTAFASVTAHITLSARTESGTVISQDFTRTYYEK